MKLDHGRLWSELPIAVVDFETTSPDPLLCQPVEVAVARFEQGRCVASYSSLLEQPGPIPPEATAIHGIADEMCKGKPRLQDVAAEIARVAQGAVPCAYNEPYDRQVMHRFICGTDEPVFDDYQRWIDVFVVIARPKVDKFVKGHGRLRLAPTCARWGVELKAAHRAMGDALATGELLWRLHEREKIRPCTLGQLLDGMEKARAIQDADHARFRARMAITTPSRVAEK
jgi:DNA polymerase-3 subunit epsilon